MKKDFPQPISEQIWTDKYRLITPNENIPNDETVSDTWDRIAKACAHAPITSGLTGKVVQITDARRRHNQRDFRVILDDFMFLPAGRITAGAGSGRQVTMFNCYVMGTIPDDMSGIFEMLKEAALTMQQGGGIGYDFSTLRPMGSPVKGVDADASGPLTFMDVWNAMCKTIMSAGYRRGAMMATMRCDHPDIEAFIVAKQDKTRLRMFNMSVLCSDKFMKAVKDDEDIDLVHIKPSAKEGHTIVGQDGNGNTLYLHKAIRARYLWDLIMKSTFDYAEPGVIFIDRINRMNNLWFVEDIVSTNPCGEQPLPPYGACLLGSINLSKMVQDPFNNPWINFNRITKTASIAVRMLDTIIDLSNFPLPQQKTEALLKRRMGIGVTGMADMLFMMNIKYGSPKAVDLVGQIMKTITVACYEESIALAKLYGPCPILESFNARRQLCESGFMQNMPEDIRDNVIKHGLRNALLTSIAPTGTISMYAGNVSSGIEPIFAPSFTRKILEKDGLGHRVEMVMDYAYKLYVDKLGDGIEDLTNLVTAQGLSPDAHLSMLAAVMPWIDSSISKTINCPEDIHFEDFKAIYMKAYDLGLKGCTTYRPNAVTGSVLSVESDEAPEAPVDACQEPPLLLTPSLTEPMPRPDNLSGTTYKLKWDTKSFYVTINDYEDDDGNTIPFEVFINSSEMANLQWTVALTRMISAVFRRGGQVKFIGEELKRISDPAGGFWVNKKFVPSFVALLGQTLQDHLKLLEQRNADNAMTETEFVEAEANSHRDQCPECYDYAIVHTDGCLKCTACGYSKCG